MNKIKKYNSIFKEEANVFKPGKVTRIDKNKKGLVDFIIIEYPKNYGDLANIVEEIETTYSDYSDSAENIIDIAESEYGVELTLVSAELIKNKIELALQLA